MRISRPHEFAQFLKKRPAEIEAVVLFGSDQGLVHERRKALEKAHLGDDPGPFQITEIADTELKASPARLVEEADAIPMLGETKFIRLRTSNDIALKAVKALLSERQPAPSSPTLVCIEVGELRKTHALRKLAESETRLAGILCNHDNAQNLEEFISVRFKKHGIEIAPEAMSVLIARLGTDRALSVRELEKLENYVGVSSLSNNADSQKKITAADVGAIVGDTTAAELDEILEAAFGGHAKQLGAALNRAEAVGINPVQILRMAQNQSEHIVRRLAGLRTPLNYYQEERLKRLLPKWSPHMAARASSLLFRAEADCKQTGRPAREICERALLSLAAGIRR